MSVGQTASLNGFVPFSPSSLWNADISSAPLEFGRSRDVGEAEQWLHNGRSSRGVAQPKWV
jgi:hypothetical protein